MNGPRERWFSTRSKRVYSTSCSKYGAGHWDFPKGHIEKNENEMAAVLREVKEETGIANIEIINDRGRQLLEKSAADTYLKSLLGEGL
jgi:8-oxo-dGTP pyrophosphatase MutT (NUDIX family)